MSDYTIRHHPEHYVHAADRGSGRWSLGIQYGMDNFESRISAARRTNGGGGPEWDRPRGGATMRDGSGAAVPGTNPVKFSWASTGNVSGSMTATLANGETFTGRFIQ